MSRGQSKNKKPTWPCGRTTPLRRPQVQEQLTEQVAGFLDLRLAPAGVMVVLEARHFCMEMRDVRKAGARTTTSAVRGAFTDERRQREFLARVGR